MNYSFSDPNYTWENVPLNETFPDGGFPIVYCLPSPIQIQAVQMETIVFSVLVFLVAIDVGISVISFLRARRMHQDRPEGEV